MSLRSRTLAAALAYLPFYVLSYLMPASLMPARAAAGHIGLASRSALVRQTSEDLLPPTGGPVIYVSNAGNDANSGLTPALAKRTIQAGIIATSPTSPTNSGTVLVEPGIYTGTGNFNLDFGALAAGGGLSGTRNITVMSDAANGGTPANTIINIAGTSANQRRGFTFVRGESAGAQIIGFTLANGNQDSGNGGAIGLGVGAGPTIQNCVFLDNEAALGGAIESAGGSPVIRECTFTNNKAVPDPGGFNPGGAIEFLTTDNTAYTPVITNCVFSGNSAPTDGAAIDISGDGNGLSPKITNCTFTQNTSVSTGPGTGGTIGVFSATPIITNCILYNDAVTGAGEIVIITTPNPPALAIVTASHDDVQGGYPGTGNISLNPNFAAGLDLAAGSPAINIGTTAVPSGVDITLDRTLRGRDSQPDLGAYEVLAPTANTQSVAVAFNTAKAVTLSGTDPNLTTRPLTYAVTSGPAHGTLSGTSSNRTYTPDNGFQGADIFTFTVNNGTYISPQVMVTLTVAVGPPTANAQAVIVPFNTATAITLTGSDPDVPALPLTYAVATGPTHGTLSGTAPNLTYTPTAGYIGSDAFTFRVSNGVNTSSAATVSITIVGAPTANNQSVAVAFNTTTAVTLTGSDPNAPPRSLTYTVTTAPAHGTLSGTAPNLTYTPTAGYTGPDSFQFTVSNGINTSSAATVSLTVNPVFLASLTFLTPVPCGTVLSGTVTLSGVTPIDVVVGLSSSNSATIRLHRAVIVLAGSSSATFEIDTFRSHVTKTVTITANLDAVTLTRDLTITGR